MSSRSSPKNDASGGISRAKNVQRDENRHLTPLKTKLCVPALRANWISRPRLINRMDEGFEGKLTLISAPAGFGKTTLLVDWVHKHKIPVAWFSVDKSDNDPARFLTYVILGLQSLEAGTGTGKAALMMLQSPQPPPIESILINLINDVIRIPTDMALVLDDYHLVDAKEIHDMMAFLLENLPEQMHMIIATRSDPPLPQLSRLRSQHQLTELRAADLIFSADETASLFNQSLNLQLSTRDIQLLETRTEGWVAGLQLAALSLQGRKNPSDFIKRFKGDNRYIADYLTEEVLNRQPEHQRNFLLQTSILGRLCGSLCDAVTRKENSRQTLNTMEKANLFVIPLDDERCWYRYHHLFADLLKQRLRRNQGELVSELHSRASQWFTNNGFKSEAVDHALVAQDYALAAQLIEEIAEIDWDRAGESRLLQWLKKLPEELIETNPMLCIFYAREMSKSGYLEDAEKRLQLADQLLESASIRDPNKAGLQGRIAVIHAYLSSRTGDVSRIIHFANQALKLLPQRDLIWRSVAATILGFGCGWAGAGDLVKAQQAFSEAMKISQTAGNIYYRVYSGSCLGGVMVVRGKLKEATDNCRQSLSLANEKIFKLKEDTAAALAELKFALSFAEPGGFIMIFVSKGKPVAELLEEIVAVKKRDHDAAKAGFSLSYVKKILSAFKAGPPPKIEGLLEPLSERELEVLQLIAAGLSNREIAGKLFISLNTVKTHTKNINSKLDVNSRIQAVARAKELGLL